MSTAFDEKIDQLLATVKTQRAEVDSTEKVAKRPWETNCSFHPVQASAPINIQTASMDMVHHIMAELLVKHNASGAAAELLGIPAVAPRYSGFTFEQWTADLQKRVAVITLNEKRKKFDEMEERLNKLVSPEKRREMELAALEAELTR